MKSMTFGEVTMKQIVDIIEDKVNEKPYSNFQVIVGTDSQNFDKTKIVLVIPLIEESKGGIFFYEITNVKKITNLKNKLYKVIF